MGNRGARFAGLDVAPVTLQQSVDGIAREVVPAKFSGLSALTLASRLTVRPASETMGCSEVTMVR